MEQSSYLEAAVQSADQEIPLFYRTGRFITMFTGAFHETLS